MPSERIPRACGILGTVAFGASQVLRNRAGTKPHGKDNRRFPPGSTHHATGRVMVQGISGGRKAPGRMQLPFRGMASIIVDRWNQKSLLSIMVRIRQHLAGNDSKRFS